MSAKTIFVVTRHVSRYVFGSFWHSPAEKVTPVTAAAAATDDNDRRVSF